MDDILDIHLGEKVGPFYTDIKKLAFVGMVRANWPLFLACRNGWPHAVITGISVGV